MTATDARARAITHSPGLETPSTTSATVSMRNVRVTYGDTVALDGVDLDSHPVRWSPFSGTPGPASRR